MCVCVGGGGRVRKRESRGGLVVAQHLWEVVAAQNEVICTLKAANVAQL